MRVCQWQGPVGNYQTMLLIRGFFVILFLKLGGISVPVHLIKWKKKKGTSWKGIILLPSKILCYVSK